MPWSPLPTSDARRGPGPEPVAGALDAVMAGLGGPSVEVIVLVHQRWDEVVGAEVAPHARPVGIDAGCLRVAVDGPGWASHLKWSEGEILARLVALVGPGQVTSVAVRVARR